MNRSTSLAWTFSLTLGLVTALPCGSAHAQLTLAHDTLARDTPTALTCGFCANEAVGVIFREIGAAAGLRPGHFPVALQSVQIALADATLTGATCMTQTTGGTVNATVEIYAGTTPPETIPPATTPPSTTALGEPWAGETLAWASDMVPIMLSTPTTAGGTSFDLQLNSFTLENTDGTPVIIAAPNTYLRVVVTLPTGGSSTMCDGISMEGPGGFPLRDNDGLIANNRSFIYATGAGWYWNEAVPGGSIAGDWGIRLVVLPMGSGVSDAGPRDAGGGLDSGTLDGGESLDGATALDTGGVVTPSTSGCACRVTQRASAARSPWNALAGGFFLIAALASRQRRG